MAENVPPGSAVKSATNADRGLPYYEKLRRDLRDTINKKRVLDKQVASLEESIYKSETAYLEETSVAGNIIKGFDNYIKAAATSASSNISSGTISGAAAGGTRRKAAINDADRIFSKSSVSYNRDGDSPGGGSAVSTPGATAAGTPTASVAGDKVDKKKKKNVANDEEDTRSTKRQKISFSRKGHDD